MFHENVNNVDQLDNIIQKGFQKSQRDFKEFFNPMTQKHSQSFISLDQHAHLNSMQANDIVKEIFQQSAFQYNRSNTFTPINSEENLYYNNNNEANNNYVGNDFGPKCEIFNDKVSMKESFYNDQQKTNQEMLTSPRNNTKSQEELGIDKTEEERNMLLKEERKNRLLREQLDFYRKMELEAKIKNHLSRDNSSESYSCSTMPNRRFIDQNKALILSHNNTSQETSRDFDYIHLSDAITRSTIESNSVKVPPKPLPRKRHSTMQICLSRTDQSQSIESFSLINPIAEELNSEEIDEEDAEVYHYMSPQVNRNDSSYRGTVNHYALNKTLSQQQFGSLKSITDSIIKQSMAQCRNDTSVIPPSEHQKLLMRRKQNEASRNDLSVESMNLASAFNMERSNFDFSSLPKSRTTVNRIMPIRKVETAEATVITPPQNMKLSENRIFFSAEENNWKAYDYYPSNATTISHLNVFNFCEFIDRNSEMFKNKKFIKSYDEEIPDNDVHKYIYISDTSCAGYLWKLFPGSSAGGKDGISFTDGRKRSVSVETSQLNRRPPENLSRQPSIRNLGCLSESTRKTNNVYTSQGAVSEWDRVNNTSRTWAQKFFKIDTKRQLFVYYDSHKKGRFKNMISFADIVRVEKYEDADERSSDYDHLSNTASYRGTNALNHLIQESKRFFAQRFRRGHYQSIALLLPSKNRKVDLILYTKKHSLLLSVPNQEIAEIWFELIRAAVLSYSSQ